MNTYHNYLRFTLEISNMGSMKSLLLLYFILLLNIKGINSQNNSIDFININDVKIIHDVNQDISIEINNSSIRGFLDTVLVDSILSYFNEFENENVTRYYLNGMTYDISYNNLDSFEMISFKIDNSHFLICVDEIINIQVGMNMQDVFNQFNNSEFRKEKVMVDNISYMVYSTIVPLSFDDIALDSYLQFIFNIDTNDLLQIQYGH